MKNFSRIITEPNVDKRSDTNEVVGVLLASSVLAWTCKPLLDGIGQKIAKSAEKSAKEGFSFWDWMFGRDKKDNKDNKDNKNNKDNKDNKDNKNNKDNKESGEKDNEAFNTALMIARQSNEKEKNANEKAKNDSMIKLLTTCSFDKDGNEIPVEERINKMKDTMSPEQFEAFKKDMTETYEKNKDSQEFKDTLAKAKANIKPEDYDKMLDDAKKEAKATLEQLDKEKKEIDEYKQKLDDLEKQMKGEKNKDKLEELKSQQAQLQQNAPTSMVSAATGVTATGEPATPTGEPEPKKGGETEPKKKSEEEIKAEHEKIEKEYKEKSSTLEKEYQDKIDKETDKDKKDALEKEWMEKEKALSADKNKKMDDIDDNDEHDTEKDETKKGKYKVQDEEIEDPETGKKIKVKTYTGPRGGKFYYPEGSPKTPENKVYVESISFLDYLLESFED